MDTKFEQFGALVKALDQHLFSEKKKMDIKCILVHLAFIVSIIAGLTLFIFYGEGIYFASFSISLGIFLIHIQIEELFRYSLPSSIYNLLSNKIENLDSQVYSELMEKLDDLKSSQLTNY